MSRPMRSDVRGPRASRIAGLLMLAAGASVAAQAPARRPPAGFLPRRSVVGRAARRVDARRLRRLDDPGRSAAAREGRRTGGTDPPAWSAGDPEDAGAGRRVDRSGAAIGRARGRHPPRPAARRRLAVADAALLRPPLRDPGRRPQRHLRRRQRRPAADRRHERAAGAEGSRLAHGAARPDRLTGRLEVFVDGETTPIMTATDRAIPPGGWAWGRSTMRAPSGASACRVCPRRPDPPVDPTSKTIRPARPVFRYTTGLR